MQFVACISSRFYALFAFLWGNSVFASRLMQMQEEGKGEEEGKRGRSMRRARFARGRTGS